MPVFHFAMEPRCRRLGRDSSWLSESLSLCYLAYRKARKDGEAEQKIVAEGDSTL
jgi:hypothetical protein